MTQITQSQLPTLLTSNKLVLVDFMANWCAPCKILGPTLEKISGQYEQSAVVCKCDIDEEYELAAEFGIRSVPTLIFFQGGAEVKRMVGLAGEEKITTVIDNLLIEHE